MAENKIRFLRGTAAEYASAVKDKDTIYFTTDDGKLYIGNKEVSGESIKALNSHINDNVKHITSTERANWNAAKTHADSAHAPSNAQVNIIETVKVNDTALTPSNKAVNITVPTKVSELTDSSDYVKTTDSRLTDARTPKAHNQASNTINTMTGYSKPSSTSAITTSDSLNTAIGKLEKALDSKQTSGSYAASNHTHDDKYYTESEIDTKLNTKLNTSLKGAASGLAELDSSGKVPSSQLPSYVDDVLEYTNKASFPAKGESGKIYIAQDTNKTYRWSGSTYVEISPSLALGETSATAYRGDRGKIAYDHSQTAHAPSNAEANQNAFSNVVVGSTTIAADSKTDTLTLAAGSNITITPDANNDKITIASTWRGIQNNLTSDSTADSLSAAQGKALKALVDGKAASSHKQAYTSDECVNFTSDDGTFGVTPAAVKKAISTFEPKSHTHSSYVNQNAFSNVVVGSTTIAADTTADTLTLVGSNVTLTPDATNDKVTIGITKANVTSALGYTPPTTNTTYSSKAAVSGGTDVSLVTTGEKYNWNAKASTAVFVKSGSGAKSGLVPAPPTTAGATKYLREDGAWVVPINTWRGVIDNLTSTDTTKSLSANQGKVLKGLVDGKAAASHTHNAMTGATSSAAGKSGLVPAPAAGDQDKFLKADGTWSVPSGGSSGSVTMTKFASFTAGPKTINNVYIPDNTILRAYYSTNSGSNSSVLEVCELFIKNRKTPTINSVLLSTGSTCNFSVNYSNDIALGKDIGKLTVIAKESSSCKIDIFIIGVDISENNS